MSRCDICGQEVLAEGRYHAACLRRLFGRSVLPSIELSLEEVLLKARKMAGKMSISGVQPKLSMVRRGSLLLAVEEGGQFILKPQTMTFHHLPENENLCMTIAAQLGIVVPPHGLFELADGGAAYLVQRFDRTADGEKRMCEDFTQILGGDKYTGSTEQIGRRLKELSEVPGLDAQLFFERVLFAFLVGNGDAYRKNYSMLETEDGSLRLSPAYDIVCSKLVIPDESECAIAVNGKKNGIEREDFESLAGYLEIPDRARDDILERFGAGSAIMAELIRDSHLSPDDQARMHDIIVDRRERVFH